MKSMRKLKPRSLIVPAQKPLNRKGRIATIRRATLAKSIRKMQKSMGKRSRSIGAVSDLFFSAGGRNLFGEVEKRLQTGSCSVFEIGAGYGVGLKSIQQHWRRKGKQVQVSGIDIFSNKGRAKKYDSLAEACSRNQGSPNLPLIAIIAIIVMAFSFIGGFYLAGGAPAITRQFPIQQTDLQQNTTTGAGTASLQNSPASARINILAVSSDGNGMVSTGAVQIIPGNGKILFELNPFVEPDTQDSVQTAAAVAQQYTGQSMATKDIIYSVENTNAQLIGGPSAGAAMTVATIAAMEEKQVRADAAITGTINFDGSIGQVGGVAEKALAAAQKGLNLFVVPTGQKVETYNIPTQQTIHRGMFSITRVIYTQQTVDLAQYLSQKGYNMRVVEAANIKDAVKLLIQ